MNWANGADAQDPRPACPAASGARGALKAVTPMTPRRCPPPWTVIENAESFWVQDAGGQTVGRFYFRQNEETARQAKVLTPGRGPTDGGELRPGCRSCLGSLIAVEPGQSVVQPFSQPDPSAV